MQLNIIYKQIWKLIPGFALFVANPLIFWNGQIMKTQSRKAKGRRLQQKFMQLLIEELDIDPEDIESRSMGAGGED